MRNSSINIFIAVILISLGAFGLWALFQNQSLNTKVLALQNQIQTLESDTINLASTSKNTQIVHATSTKQIVQVQKSQDQLLTGAVAKAAPAVVSIIISQYAPQYEVRYENPFGNDPRFQGIGLEIPVYHQIGTQLQKVGAGSGLLFTHNGYIVTNKHVIFDPKAQYAVLLSDGTQKIAEVIYRDPVNDIAVIKIPGNYKTVASLGNSTSLQLGQTVAAIGNALGEYNNSISVGIISGLNRSVTASDEMGNTETLSNIIQTDAAINPGNSGGPLVNLNGDVIAINVATVQGGNSIGFAIPINIVKPILNKY